MKLFIMRHGIAGDREKWTGPDAKRPLTPEGIEKTRCAVRGLQIAVADEAITLVASSPLLRAHQTAKIARESLGVKAKVAIWPELESAAFQPFAFQPFACQPLLVRLKEANQSTLIVGHEPGLGGFTAHLLTGSAQGLSMEWKKAAVGALEIDFSGEEPHATLLWFATPRQLRAMGRK